MTDHQLDPLLRPASIALLGASERRNTPGHVLADMTSNSAFAGRVYPINPRYPAIFNQTCYPDLASLPETVDHLVIALGNAHLEQALREVIAHGARAATISPGAFSKEIYSLICGYG